MILVYTLIFLPSSPIISTEKAYWCRRLRHPYLPKPHTTHMYHQQEILLGLIYLYFSHPKIGMKFQVLYRIEIKQSTRKAYFEHKKLNLSFYLMQCITSLSKWHYIFGRRFHQMVSNVIIFLLTSVPRNSHLILIFPLRCSLSLNHLLPRLPMDQD